MLPDRAKFVKCMHSTITQLPYYVIAVLWILSIQSLYPAGRGGSVSLTENEETEDIWRRFQRQTGFASNRALLWARKIMNQFLLGSTESDISLNSPLLSNPSRWSFSSTDSRSFSSHVLFFILTYMKCEWRSRCADLASTLENLALFFPIEVTYCTRNLFVSGFAGFTQNPCHMTSQFNKCSLSSE